ncbi:hypothetical protein SDC9_188748 [bioreactor metagenome]|uniref:Ferrous iron transport protein B n=1 Tax=bioreactor metagenome TaxID=1076179 RepID=A0A645HRJ3_9ZZZZ
MEITPKVIVCVNLIDEARKKNISVDINALEQELGVPVVATAARDGEGLNTLIDTLYQVANGSRITSPRKVLYSDEVEEAIQQLLPDVVQLFGSVINPRWIALRLLDGDNNFIKCITHYLSVNNHQRLEAVVI